MTREETIYELGEWLEQMIQHGVPSHSAKRKALATAIALLSAEYEDYEHATLVDIKEPLKVLVVRCKDCRHYSVEGETTRFGWCGYWNKPTDEMRYCSDGERREECD